MIQELLFKYNEKNQSSDRKAARFMEDGKVKVLKLLESSNKGVILPLLTKHFR